MRSSDVGSRKTGDGLGGVHFRKDETGGGHRRQVVRAQPEESRLGRPWGDVSEKGPLDLVPSWMWGEEGRRVQDFSRETWKMVQ